MISIPSTKNSKIVWGLLGKNKGDNTQIEMLCGALGESFDVAPEFKTILCKQRFVAPNIFRKPSLKILTENDRNKLSSPWPDVVVGTGRKTVAVARWIKLQSNNKTKLVWIGRPKAPLNWFDLVVSTPQYGLPDHPNVFKLKLPLVFPVQQVAPPKEWQEHVRPWVGVLVGGDNFPLIFNDVSANRLSKCINLVVGDGGGTAFISTSPRTGSEITVRLRAGISSPHVFCEWQPGGESFHQQIIANADKFIITGDSATMLAEACVTGKPVTIFALYRSRLWPRWQAKKPLVAWMIAQGFLAPPRDVSVMHRVLIEEEIADFDCQSKWQNRNNYNQHEDLSKVVSRVKMLF